MPIATTNKAIPKPANQPPPSPPKPAPQPVNQAPRPSAPAPQPPRPPSGPSGLSTSAPKPPQQPANQAPQPSPQAAQPSSTKPPPNPNAGTSRLATVIQQQTVAPSVGTKPPENKPAETNNAASKPTTGNSFADSAKKAAEVIGSTLTKAGVQPNTGNNPQPVPTGHYENKPGYENPVWVPGGGNEPNPQNVKSNSSPFEDSVASLPSDKNRTVEPQKQGTSPFEDSNVNTGANGTTGENKEKGLSAADRLKLKQDFDKRSKPTTTAPPNWRANLTPTVMNPNSGVNKATNVDSSYTSYDPRAGLPQTMQMANQYQYQNRDFQQIAPGYGSNPAIDQQRAQLQQQQSSIYRPNPALAVNPMNLNGVEHNAAVDTASNMAALGQATGMRAGASGAALLARNGFRPRPPVDRTSYAALGDSAALIAKMRG